MGLIRTESAGGDLATMWGLPSKHVRAGERCAAGADGESVEADRAVDLEGKVAGAHMQTNEGAKADAAEGQVADAHTGDNVGANVEAQAHARMRRFGSPK